MKITKTLLEQIYTNKECSIIKELYNDESCRHALQQAIGNKLSLENNKLINSNGLDALFLICSSSSFASSDESNRVALIIFHMLKVPQPLPSIVEHFGMELAERVFVSSCFFKMHMIHRCKYRGYPSLDFYKSVAKNIFNTHNNEDISEHFELWEDYLYERFV
jgi:hypothetical protein